MIHSKLDNRPSKREPRRDFNTGEPILVTRTRPELARSTRRFKRRRPAGTSLKDFMEDTPEGLAWLARKRLAR